MGVGHIWSLLVTFYLEKVLTSGIYGCNFALGNQRRARPYGRCSLFLYLIYNICMKIYLKRYYGDYMITMSVMTVMSDDDEVMMECEAREMKFADYTKAFEGSSKCCLAVGTFAAKTKSTALSPFHLTIMCSPGHHCCRFSWDVYREARVNTVLVGDVDIPLSALDLPRDGSIGGDVLETIKHRKPLTRQQETFETLEQLLCKAYIGGEKITVTVDNDGMIYSR